MGSSLGLVFQVFIIAQIFYQLIILINDLHRRD